MGLQGLFIFIIMLFRIYHPTPHDYYRYHRKKQHLQFSLKVLVFLCWWAHIESILHYTSAIIFQKFRELSVSCPLFLFCLPKMWLFSGAFLSHGVFLPSHGAKHDMLRRSSMAQLARISGFLCHINSPETPWDPISWIQIVFDMPLEEESLLSIWKKSKKFV